MAYELIELHAGTQSSRWITEIFQSPILKFDQQRAEDRFPLYIVHASKGYSMNREFFERLDTDRKPFGLIHIRDENYDHDRSLYGLSYCRVVFRNFLLPQAGKAAMAWARSLTMPVAPGAYRGWWKRLAARGYHRLRFSALLRRQLRGAEHAWKVVSFPLGTLDHFPVVDRDHCRPISERQFRWSFCGETRKSDRPLMLRELAGLGPSIVWDLEGRGSFGRFEATAYRDLLADSVFVPCPMGNANVEAPRLYEALEVKAIPIVVNRSAGQPFDYYHSLLGSHPVPSFPSWREARHFVATCSPDQASALSREIEQWYKRFKGRLQSTVQERIHQVADAQSEA